MLNDKNFDFSFSGLKTALLYKIQKMIIGKTEFRNIVMNLSARSWKLWSVKL